MVDLSFLPMDGGGTQYTFLDAIYHNCAIILNRRWIENVDAQYRDFKEDHTIATRCQTPKNCQSY
jgi:hypothetical protein